MEFINSLSVLGALVALAMITVGLLISFFTSLFQRRWLATLLSMSLVLSPIAAKKLKLPFAFWLLMGGTILFIACLCISEWVNPRFFWFE